LLAARRLPDIAQINRTPDRYAGRSSQSAWDTDRFRSNVEATAKKKNISYDAAVAERVATVPAKRIGQPDELGTMCAFLCSTHAGYITGQNILIDGGTFPGAF
jgi:3-oxoacyl-[acyl-carrier protein] reductase